MTDPDVCQRQLDAVNNEIERVSAANKTIDDDKENAKQNYDSAEREYNKKKNVEASALTDFNNIKKTTNHEVSQGQGAWSGQNDCENHCRGWHNNTYNDSSVAISHQNRCNARCAYGYCCAGRWECLCYGPDVNQFKAKRTAYETAKKETATAQTDMESKKAVYQTSLQKPYTMANINVACCTNTTVCAPGAECDNIKQSCQAEITTMKEEKAQKEAIDKADAEAKAAADKSQKEAKDKADAVAKTGGAVPTGQATTSSSGSSDNTPLYVGGGVLILCCSCFMFMFMFMMMNKNR